MSEMKRHADQTFSRAEHHAKNIVQVLPALIGYVETYSDSGTVKRNYFKGKLANVAWASFGGRRIAFGYNHKTGNIEAREGSLKGLVIAVFNDDNTSLHGLTKFFKSL